MKKFVRDDSGEFHPVEPQKIGEQGIVEKAKTRKRHRGPHHGIVAGCLHRRRHRVRGLLIEVSAVRNRADDREPPFVRLKRVARRAITT